MAEPIPLRPEIAHYSVEQALDIARDDKLKEVILVGYDQEGDLRVIASHMSNKDGLWLLEKARLHVLGLE